MKENIYFENLYKARFSPREIEKKNEIWKVFCEEFLSKFIRKNDTVMDLGAGYCEFINNIECKKKIALDINPDTAKYKAPDVKLVINDCTQMKDIRNDSIDVVFNSNFFEHLPTKNALLETLVNIYRVLKPTGRLIILMPNIHYCYAEYWDFFDHVLPISHKALDEILRAIGFEIEVIYPRFLPFTTKAKFPKFLFLIKLYLKVPILYRIFGKQLFIVAKKPLLL